MQAMSDTTVEILSKRGLRLGTPEPGQDLLVECFIKAYKNSYSQENPQVTISWQNFEWWPKMRHIFYSVPGNIDI